MKNFFLFKIINYILKELIEMFKDFYVGINDLFKPKITFMQKMIFIRELSIMLKAGLPIIDCLQNIRQSEENIEFVRVITNIIRSIKNGYCISKAFARHPKVFTKIYLASFIIGEKTGEISDVLNKLAVELERKNKRMQAIKAALIYPLFVIIGMMGFLCVANFVVLPKFSAIYALQSTQLPFLTKFVLVLFKVLTHPGVWLITPLIIAYSIYRFKKFISVKYNLLRFHVFLFQIPFVKSLLLKFCLIEFIETFEFMYTQGFPLAACLTVSAETSFSPVFTRAILRALKNLENGETLSESFQFAPDLFPYLFTTSINISETTGNFDVIMKNIAQLYRNDFNLTIEKMLVLVEPLLIFSLGLIVAILLIALLMPLYTLFQQGLYAK